MDTHVLWTVCACAHEQVCVSENVGNEKDSNHPPPQFKSIRCDQEGMLYSTSGKTEVWMVWPLAGERATLERTRVLVRMLTWELTSNSSPKRLDAPGLCQGPGTHTEHRLTCGQNAHILCDHHSVTKQPKPKNLKTSKIKTIRVYSWSFGSFPKSKCLEFKIDQRRAVSRCQKMKSKNKILCPRSICWQNWLKCLLLKPTYFN